MACRGPQFAQWVDRHLCKNGCVAWKMTQKTMMFEKWRLKVEEEKQWEKE
jgi:hypothetical protein